mmetsp:Transcript_164839/g.528944  ORF Transcript_164839/g.528944 Transcript_164839/m.528944 type:complete len:327 (-) Transcript_164839:2826-3806(-)
MLDQLQLALDDDQAVIAEVMLLEPLPCRLEGFLVAAPHGHEHNEVRLAQALHALAGFPVRRVREDLLLREQRISQDLCRAAGLPALQSRATGHDGSVQTDEHSWPRSSVCIDRPDDQAIGDGLVASRGVPVVACRRMHVKPGPVSEDMGSIMAQARIVQQTGPQQVHDARVDVCLGAEGRNEGLECSDFQALCWWWPGRWRRRQRLKWRRRVRRRGPRSEPMPVQRLSPDEGHSGYKVSSSRLGLELELRGAHSAQQDGQGHGAQCSQGCEVLVANLLQQTAALTCLAGGTRSICLRQRLHGRQSGTATGRSVSLEQSRQVSSINA